MWTLRQVKTAGCLATLMFGVIGCQFPPRQATAKPPVETDLVPAEPADRSLGPALRRFVDFAGDEVTRAANRIQVETTDPDVKRAALIWKIELLPDLQHDLATKQPLQMLIDTWALWIRVAQYLREGEGQALFGACQPLAIEAATAVLQEVERLGRQYLPADNQAQIIQQINAYAREHPIRGVFEHETIADFGHAEEGRGIVQRLLSAPLRAVGKVGAGLDPTLRLSQSVDRFTDLMSGYPAMARWEAQLLLHEMEQMTAVETAVRSVADLSDASLQLATTAEQLPQRMREESQALLDELDTRQPELRVTLQELRATLEALNESLTRAETVAERAEQIVAGTAEAGDSWTITAAAVKDAVAQIQQFGNPSPTSAPSTAPLTPPPAESSPRQRPFDIDDYTRTAEALNEATGELRALLHELEAFLDGDSIDRGARRAGALTTDVLDDTEGRMRGLIDHAFWRTVQIALTAFVAAVIYRLLHKRFFAV